MACTRQNKELKNAIVTIIHHIKDAYEFQWILPLFGTFLAPRPQLHKTGARAF